MTAPATDPVRGVEPTSRADGSPSAATWPRLLATCLLLTGLVFVQTPGRVATDTKLDLTVDPWGFLSRSLHLWEPTGFFGQVQNQAYGYLFPTGPFFGVGELLDLPDWVTQRLWWSLLLCAAVVGVDRLATALHIGTPWTRLAAAVLYALSPRMLTVIGPTSVEVLPMALAPWVVLPLVQGSVRGSPRRAAALSGVAVLLAGGVNATASLALLVPPALYLLSRAPGPRRWRLAGWWTVAVGLATAWWVVPLLVLGRYSPPFLDWIESASVTTSVTSLASSLRGVSQWVAYLTSPAGPDYRAGWQLLTVPAVVLHTMLVVALGVMGLALPRLKERLWLVLTLLAGLALVTFGHVGAVDGGLAEVSRAALDGVLAPLRNTHKFDLVLRLPLVLGVAHGLAWLSVALGRRDGSGGHVLPAVVRYSALGVLAVVVVGATAPFTTNQLVPRGSYEAVPGYWEETSAWLGQHDADGRALVVPGASFGTYIWGRTRDEPLQPMADSPWGVRDAVPLTPAGTIRALDAVQRRLADGVGSTGLAPMLARMGVRYLVVRNDLDTVPAYSPRPVVVHAALQASPGLSRVAGFGPTVGTGSTDDLRVDQGLDVGYPAVEVWSVSDAQPRVSVVPESDVLGVVGGPESLLDLSDRGLAPDRPAVLIGDRAAMPIPATVVTDGMRRREANFGRVDDSTSFTLAESDPLRLSAAARDYLPFDGYETVARWYGVASVGASSSAADADAPWGANPASLPFAAVDGDPSTSWQSSGARGAVGQWLEVRFVQPLDPTGAVLTVSTDDEGTEPSLVTVSTDGGEVQQQVRPDAPTRLTLPPGDTSRLRVTLTGTRTTPPGRSFVVRELAVPGVDVSRSLWTPGAGSAAYLTVADGARRGCLSHEGAWLCAAGLERPGEESVLDRVVHLAPGDGYQVSATVTPRPGPALDALLDAGWEGGRVTASSTSVRDPAGRPQVVVDGAMGTGWVAAPEDRSPRLTLQLSEERDVTGLSVRVDDRLAASTPTSVTVSAPSGQRRGELGPGGTVTFRSLRTDRLTLEFPTVHVVQSYDPRARLWETLPVGVSELTVTGAEDLLDAPDPGRTVVLGCSAGPSVTIGTQVVRLAVAATAEEVLLGKPVAAVPCDATPSVASSGRTRVRMASGPTWVPRSVDLASPDALAAPVASTTDAEVLQWDPTQRLVQVGPRPTASLLVVRENTNQGWVATFAGRELDPVVVDGWQQAWRLPAGGTGAVHLVYRPDRPYRWGLLAGSAATLLLVGLSVVRGRSTLPSLLPVRAPTWVTVVVTCSALWLLAGAEGALAGLAGLVLVRILPERFRPLVGMGAGASVAAAGVLLALGPWGRVDFAGNDRAPQLACLVGLGLVVGVLGTDPRVRRLRPARGT